MLIEPHYCSATHASETGRLRGRTSAANANFAKGRNQLGAAPDSLSAAPTLSRAKNAQRE